MPPREAPAFCRFLPLERAYYPLLRRWLALPHVHAWWGDPDAEIALMEEEIDTGPTRMFVVATAAGEPFAFVQDWDASEGPQFASLPPGSRAIDTFLGEPACLGRGHAGRYLRQRAEALLAEGVPAVGIDPDPRNARAIRAYAAAGFAGARIVPDERGAPVRIMRFGGGAA